MPRLGSLDGEREVAVVPRRVEQLEVEREVELVVAALTEVHGLLLDREVRLADQHASGELIRNATQPANHVVDLGPVHAP